MRINKYIARSGFTSRKKAEDFILNKAVKVNGKIMTDLFYQVKTDDIVSINEQKLVISESKLYIFYKPKGCLTSKKDDQDRKIIYNYLPKKLHTLIPIGRLDYNSEGLLLLTNDGMLKREFELPKNQYKRTYLVRFHGQLTAGQIKQIKSGIEIDNITYRVIDLKITKKGENSWCEIILAEGKNREIRNILAHFNIEVSRLIRVSYGQYKLGNMQAGECKEVTLK